MSKLRHIFRSFVEETQRDHPRFEGVLAVADIEGEAVHGKIALPKTTFSTFEAANQFLSTMVGRSTTIGSPIAYRKEGLNLLVYKDTPEALALFPFAAEEKERAALAILDHELAHLLVPGAARMKTLGERLKSECAADTYCALRMLQRYGQTQVNTIEFLARERAMQFVFYNDVEHFTTPSLLALAAEARRTNLQTLTPPNTVLKAGQMAEYHAPDEQKVKGMQEKFALVRIAVRAEGGIGETAYKALASVARLHKDDPEVLRISAIILKPLIADGTLKGPYWEGVGRGLDLAQKALSAGRRRPESRPASGGFSVS